MTDNGLAALAAALDAADAALTKNRNSHTARAAAILGERGVFLPDGLPRYIPAGITLPGKSREDYIDEANESLRVLMDEREQDCLTIATLRAALDEALGYLDKISPSGYHVERARAALLSVKI
jgi:hypothetical protein